MYDENYREDLLREENILYTKDGKNIRELLSNGREVPYSHRPNASTNNKAQIEADVNSDNEYNKQQKQKRDTDHLGLKPI